MLEDNILALALYDARCLEELRRAGRQQWSSAERELLATVLLEEDNPQNRPKKLQKADIYVKMVSLRAEERYAAWNSGDRYVAMCQLLRDKEDKHNKQTQQELLATGGEGQRICCRGRRCHAAPEKRGRRDEELRLAVGLR